MMSVLILCYLGRAIVRRTGGIPRPLINISSENFAKLFDKAVGYKLDPPFDPYEDTIKYLLAVYVIPYVGLTGYVGTNPCLKKFPSKQVNKTPSLPIIDL